MLAGVFNLLYKTHIVKRAFGYNSVIYNLAKADGCVETDKC